MSELAVQENNYTMEEIAAQLGAASKSGPTIPTLKMNYEPDDAPLGSFYLKSGANSPVSSHVYATENVRIRAFSNHIQYQHWDEKDLVNKSILLKSQREEARDMLGGFACGMPQFETLMAMSPEERKKYEGMDRYRVIRGLITYTGKTIDGDEVAIENQPFKLETKRKNYGPFWHDVIKRLPNGMNLWDFESILSIDKRKNSYGKTYYVMRFNPQFANPLPMDQMTYDSLAYVTKLVTDENARINQAYKEALNMEREDRKASTIVDKVEQALDADVA